MGKNYAGYRPTASQFNITSARYICTDSTTVVSSGATNLVPFASVSNATDEVSPNSSGVPYSLFNINRDGIYVVEFLTRWVATGGNSTGDIYVWAALNGNVEICGHDIAAPISNAPCLNSMTIRPLFKGDFIQVKVRNFINSGMQFASSGEGSHLTITYLQGVD